MENEKEILLEELETVAETPVSGRKTAAKPSLFKNKTLLIPLCLIACRSHSVFYGNG